MNTQHAERLDNGVVVIHLDDPGDKVNKLSQEMLSELDQNILDLERDPTVRGLIFFSDKKENFLAGADLKEVGQITEPGVARDLIHRVHNLFNRIENLPFPVVAAIHGHCLGGGLELALACHYRIATDHPKTQVGLPEVKLGLLPAGGGTQRLTRLIGVRRALPLMLQGKTLSASHAKALGIVDLSVYPYRLLDIAGDFILGHLQEPRRTKYEPEFPSFDWLLKHVPPARIVFFSLSRRQVQKKTLGNYPAPMRLLQCVEIGFRDGSPAGFTAEAEAFDALVLSAQSQALRRLFFDVTAVKKQHPSKEQKYCERIGVLGSGLMGSGISIVSARGGSSVVLKDVSMETLTGGLKNIWTHFDGEVKKHRLRPVERDKLFGRIVPTLEYGHFSEVDLVIEAVFEDLELKRRVLKEVEEHSHPECIFASNTSAIPISEIASVSMRPELVIGMHYFSPVPRMPLLEIVVTPKTPEWVVGTAASLGKRQGKTVIVVRDGPGFYTSRILAAYMYEAVALLHDWARIEDVDHAMRRFGFPLGPFKLLDEVGIDVAARVSQDLTVLFRRHGFAVQNRLKDLVSQGYQGRKNGNGFYQYSARRHQSMVPLSWMGRARKVNEEIYRFFGGDERRNLEITQIQERMALAMVNEAVRTLQEGIITNPRDGDVGAVLGLGFPPFLGGPFRYLEQIGIEQAVIKLEKLMERLGPRFEPAPILSDMVKREERFYRDG